MCATGLSVTGGQGQGSHCGPEWAGMALWRRQGLPGPCERRQDSGRWSGERRAFRVVTPVWSVEGCLSGKWRHVSRAEQGMNRMGRQEEESEFPSGGPQSRRVPRQAALGMNDSGRGRE